VGVRVGRVVRKLGGRRRIGCGCRRNRKGSRGFGIGMGVSVGIGGYIGSLWGWEMRSGCGDGFGICWCC